MNERYTENPFYDPDFSKGGLNISLSRIKMHRMSLRKTLVRDVDFLPDGTIPINYQKRL
jgi:hypothetical protein